MTFVIGKTYKIAKVDGTYENDNYFKVTSIRGAWLYGTYLNRSERPYDTLESNLVYHKDTGREEKIDSFLEKDYTYDVPLLCDTHKKIEINNNSIWEL